MRAAAYILTLLMLFLVVQPIVVECVAASSAEPAKAACKMKRSCPMKPACPKEDENNECERSTSCNPFASCSQCHFVNASKFLYAPAMGMVRNSRTIMPGEKLVAGFIADCWQPPEFVLLHTTN